MKIEEKKELESIVAHEIEQLRGKIEEIKEFTVPTEPDCAVDRISRSEALNNKSIVVASMKNLQVRLDLLQKISQVIHEPEYGICTSCHKPIQFNRLKIRPEVRICAHCSSDSLYE